MTESNRITHIDLAKGICIILIVFFHTKGILGRTYAFDPFLASFRMPLYFFLSGYFFKTYGSFSLFIRKKTNRLLIPFAAFYLLTAVLLPNVLHYCFNIRFETVVGLPSLFAFVYPGEYPNIPIWFLLCLFIVNSVFYLMTSVVNHYCHHHRSVLLTLTTASLLCCPLGYALQAFWGTDIASLFKAFQSIPFFCLGFLWREHGIQGGWGMAFIMALATFVMSIFIYDDPGWKAKALITLSGLTGSLMVFYLSKMLVSIPYVSYLGRYSIILLLTHGLLVRIVAGDFGRHTVCRHSGNGNLYPRHPSGDDR